MCFIVSPCVCSHCFLISSFFLSSSSSSTPPSSCYAMSVSFLCNPFPVYPFPILSFISVLPSFFSLLDASQVLLCNVRFFVVFKAFPVYIFPLVSFLRCSSSLVLLCNVRLSFRRRVYTASQSSSLVCFSLRLAATDRGKQTVHTSGAFFPSQRTSAFVQQETPLYLASPPRYKLRVPYTHELLSKEE